MSAVGGARRFAAMQLRGQSEAERTLDWPSKASKAAESAPDVALVGAAGSIRAFFAGTRHRARAPKDATHGRAISNLLKKQRS